MGRISNGRQGEGSCCQDKECKVDENHFLRFDSSTQAITFLMCGIVCLTKGESVCGGFRYVEADQDCFTGKAKTGDASDDKQFVYKLVPKTKR